MPLPSCFTSIEALIWFYTHIDTNSKCLALHSSCDFMYIRNAFCFLTKPLPNHLYINNDTSLYVVNHVSSLFIFTTTNVIFDMWQGYICFVVFKSKLYNS